MSHESALGFLFILLPAAQIKNYHFTKLSDLVSRQTALMLRKLIKTDKQFLLLFMICPYNFEELSINILTSPTLFSL